MRRQVENVSREILVELEGETSNSLKAAEEAAGRAVRATFAKRVSVNFKMSRPSTGGEYSGVSNPELARSSSAGSYCRFSTSFILIMRSSPDELFFIFDLLTELNQFLPVVGPILRTLCRFPIKSAKLHLRL